MDSRKNWRLAAHVSRKYFGCRTEWSDMAKVWTCQCPERNHCVGDTCLLKAPSFVELIDLLKERGDPSAPWWACNWEMMRRLVRIDGGRVEAGKKDSDTYNLSGLI